MVRTSILDNQLIKLLFVTLPTCLDDLYLRPFHVTVTRGQQTLILENLEQ